METPPAPRPIRSSEPQPTRFSRAIRTLLSPSGIAVIVVLVAVALIATMTELGSEPPRVDGEQVPREIERLQPRNGDLISPESTVGVDLGPGLTGRLVIDGTSIPDDQLTVQGGGRVSFQPGEQPCVTPAGERGSPISVEPCRPQAKDIERFSGGTHTITAIYWDDTERESAGSSAYTWTFRVAA